MWLTIIEFFGAHAKLLAYGLVVALYPVCYFVGDLHGHSAEKFTYYKATNAQEVKDEQQQAKENTQEANKAIVQETQVSKDVSQLDSSKEQVKQKINDLSKQDPCTTNKLSDDERVYLNSLIDQANK